MRSPPSSSPRAQLTTRVTEKKSLPRGRQAARLAANPLGGPVGVKGTKKTPGKGSASSDKLVSGGGIQQGLSLSRSAGALLQPPSWDPVKGSPGMVASAFKQSPLWRDDALDASGGSKSLMRALASTGSLIRPSIKANEEYATRRESRRMSLDASSVASSKKANALPTSAEVLAFKNGEAEGFIGKIHDEELVEQQLDGALKKMKDKLAKTTLEMGSPFNMRLERQLHVQGRVIESRGNALLSKANDVRASNGGLRDIISKLRLERRLHSQHKDGMEARLAELSKLIPALVDQCNVLLFEGEKVQTKVQQTHQDAMAQRTQQEEQLNDSTAQVVHTEQLIVRHEQAHYENEQQHAREMYNLARSLRGDENTQEAKLGYLRWKTDWWVREFERLKGATGLQLDFSSLASGGELDTQPISDMMNRYTTQSGDIESLERFLDSKAIEQNALEIELSRTRAERMSKEDEVARGGARVHYGAPRLSALVAECDDLQAQNDKAESLLLKAFPPTKNILEALIEPADFAANVRAAEAVREGRYPEEEGEEEEEEEAWSPAEPPSAAPSEAYAPGASSPQDVSDAAAPSYAPSYAPSAAPSFAPIAAPTAAEPPAAAAAKSPPKSPGRARRSPVLVGAEAGEVPSAMLAASAAELELGLQAQRVRLLSDALDRCENELLGIHEATRTFPRILDTIAHPHKSTKERLPLPLKRWAGNQSDLDVKNVHMEFKRLAAEAEKRQREEANREDAAAEEKAASRRGRGSMTPSKSAVSPKPAAAAAYGGAAPKGDALNASSSMPALS